MVGKVGLKPTTYAGKSVTLSLSYFPMSWSEYKDSNLGPSGPKPDALPGCATLRNCLR